MGRDRYAVRSSRLHPDLCKADMSCGLWSTTVFEMVSMRAVHLQVLILGENIPRQCIRDGRDVHTWPVVAAPLSAHSRTDRPNTVRQIQSGSELRSNPRPLELRWSLGSGTRQAQKRHPPYWRPEASRVRGETIGAAYPRTSETANVRGQ